MSPLEVLEGLLIVGFASACQPDRSFVPFGDCAARVDEVIYHHACQHGMLGPFETAVAVADRSSAPPRVTAAQRALDVMLPTGSVNADRLSYVRYVPPRDGQHAVFAGAAGYDVSVTLWFADEALEPTVIEPVILVMPTSACGGMASVVGYELVQGDEYVVEIGPTDAPSIRMFVEHLPTFGATWMSPCPD